MLLKKELKNSDVGSLGRIVLPKVRFSLSMWVAACSQILPVWSSVLFSFFTPIEKRQ